MNNRQRARELVDQFVLGNGNETEMSWSEFLAWVNKSYESISAERNNLYPTDLCYNLYNKGLTAFPDANLCLYYDVITEKYRLVGSKYKYTGNVYQYKGTANERVVGRWINGEYQMIEQELEESTVPDAIANRSKNLLEGLKIELKAIPVTVDLSGKDIFIRFQDDLICGTSVEEEGYRIFNATKAWSEQTTYLCEDSGDGTRHYFLETMDEVIGEVKRLVLFEAQRDKHAPQSQNASALRRNVTPEKFEKAFIKFLEQADKNAKTKKSEGSKMPFGFTSTFFDGADFLAQYGHGAASKTPHMNWWVLSIYYVVETGKIVMGIEEHRYPHLKEMKPLRYKQVGNKKENIAVFYESFRDNIDYAVLHAKFIEVAEEIMRLGLK